MKITGLIVEYNPFHNGHYYHLNKSKKIINSNYTIAIMSGNFLQRGEPALFNKWIRTKMALKAGVDVVIELPFAFSSQSAELFAYGAIGTLDKLGIVDYIVFGSENNDLETLEEISKILAKEPLLFKNLLKFELKKGLNFPKARSIALEKYMMKQSSYSDSIANTLNEPNNILGIEYIKWIHRLESSITPKNIKRIGSSYHDIEIKNKFSSATAIRNELIYKHSPLECISDLIPPFVYSIMKEEIAKNNMFGNIEALSQTILSILSRDASLGLDKFIDISEGLDNRFYKHLNTNSIVKYIDLMKTKRYTQTRIQRILTHLLLNFTKNDLDFFLKEGGIQYIRVLGFRQKGKEILKELKNNCKLPIITNLSKSYPSLNATQQKMMDFDILSTNLYNLHFSSSTNFKNNMDFLTSPIIMD